MIPSPATRTVLNRPAAIPALATGTADIAGHPSVPRSAAPPHRGSAPAPAAGGGYREKHRPATTTRRRPSSVPPWTPAPVKPAGEQGRNGWENQHRRGQRHQIQCALRLTHPLSAHKMQWNNNQQGPRSNSRWRQATTVRRQNADDAAGEFQHRVVHPLRQRTTNATNSPRRDEQGQRGQG